MYSATRVILENIEETHNNSAYIATILKTYNHEYGEQEHLVTAHWTTPESKFCAIYHEEKYSFINWMYKTWVIDYRLVCSGSNRLYCRTGTDDIKDDSRKEV